MVVKVKSFGLEQQKKILERYKNYFDKGMLQWVLPGHAMKNLIGECWDLSHILNKHKNLEMNEVLDNIRFDTLVDVKDNYNRLSQEDFYKWIVGELRRIDKETKQTL